MRLETALDVLTMGYIARPCPDIFGEVVRLGDQAGPDSLLDAREALSALGWAAWERDGKPRFLRVPEHTADRIRAHPEWEAAGISVSNTSDMSMTVAFCRTYIWAWERNLL